ncbi:ImmA/IrrE family metallo-endopeptidase [Brevibacillus sp. NSP2.1]|uniref:ImmA/IrrE family metallo-endopeptidase n=1 Tax=Brevibacillus sp. NSP2.1 TaxID=3003229 RepID=UPI000555FAB9|nr:ImmA/IrrE family metallo-endopeptidase [Brevibacillus sp. NSP2.1]QHZ55775.1 ImmA/IrrE family metallo-endopeptidase [Brevibacillus sp. NSP2.1]
MFEFYQTTPLEQWIQTRYKSIGIQSPADLVMDVIAHSFGIDLFYLPNAKEEAIWNDDNAAIFLNSNKSIEEIREVFFHELCHPLRHAGDQLMLPRIFRELQETQANQFQLYAAMPFFMVKEIKLPPYKNEAIGFLAQQFGVTTRLAKRRLEQIERRIYEARLHKEFVSVLQSQYSKADPANWSDETKKLFRLAIQRKLQKGQGVVVR